MLYIQRAIFDPEDKSKNKVPFKYDYMGSSEFEQGGVGKTLTHLARDYSRTIVSHEQFSVHHGPLSKGGKRTEILDLWLLGIPLDVESVVAQLHGHFSREHTVRSKEAINFTDRTDEYAHHDSGFEIYSNVFLTMHRGLALFMQDFVGSPLVYESRLNNTFYPIGRSVTFYNKAKDKVDHKAVVKGQPQDTNLVTIESRKKKHVVPITLVIPNID